MIEARAALRSRQNAAMKAIILSYSRCTSSQSFFTLSGGDRSKYEEVRYQMVVP